VLGWVHVGEHVERAGRAVVDALGEVVIGAVVEDRVEVGVVEEVGLALDLEDVGVLADEPQVVEPVDARPAKRHVLSKPRVRRVEDVGVDMGLGQHDRACDLVGYGRAGLEGRGHV
jgi:hypothetical protein